MSDEDKVQRFTEAVRAAEEVERWSAGAQALALLTAVRDLGWTQFLRVPRDLGALAEFSGLSPARLTAVVAALQAHDIVVRPGDAVRLSPHFAALAADDAWIALGDVLDRAELAGRQIQRAAEGTRALAAHDALVIARSAGGRPAPTTAALFEQLLAELPEWADTLPDGRRLDVGCGVATTAITLATMFPRLRTTALELVPDVAAEARRRAAQRGVADRLEVRCMDARDLAEEDAYDVAFWAQPFFPEPARAATLAMIRRALRPGGLLTMQEEAEPPGTDPRALALHRLERDGRPARRAEQLAAEGEAAGFTLLRVAATGFGYFVLMTSR